MVEQKYLRLLGLGGCALLVFLLGVCECVLKMKR
jgi:hypothetical protein